MWEYVLITAVLSVLIQVIIHFTNNYTIVSREKPTKGKKRAFILQYIKQHNYTDVDVDDRFVDDVYDLYHNHNIKYKLDDMNEIALIAFYGVYYKHNLQYNIMVEHFLKAATLGNICSYNVLAIHYAKVKDYDNVFKYCLLAIEHDNFDRLTKFIDLVVEQNKAKYLIKLYQIKPILFNSDEYTKMIYEATKKLINRIGITDEISVIVGYIDIKYFDPNGNYIYPYKKLLMKNHELSFESSEEYKQAREAFMNKTQ